MPKEEHPNRHNSADFGEWEQIGPRPEILMWDQVLTLGKH